MGKRRRKESLISVIFNILFALINILIEIIVRIIVLVYDIITYYTSDYKNKSGNGLFNVLFDQGVYGEFMLYRKLIKVFGKAFVLTNLYLDGKNTDLTEIDLLAISKKGVYVFEMKNYGGSIYGSYQDKEWTQVFNKFSKHRFYNPLRQNYVHTKAVENYLALEQSALIPMVVFSNKSKLSKINVRENTHVYQFKDAMRKIKLLERDNLKIFTDQELENITKKLILKSHADETVKQAHIEGVKAITAR